MEQLLSKKKAIAAGTASVFGVLVFGMGLAFATGVASPASVLAVVQGDPCCSTLFDPFANYAYYPPMPYVDQHTFGYSDYGGGGGGGYVPAPTCELELTKDSLVWDTENATSVDIVPLTSSPAIPMTDEREVASTDFSGDFWNSFQQDHFSTWAADASANGGVALGSGDGFYGDKKTADRLCEITFPGSSAGTYQTDSYTSPGNNMVARWTGSAWERKSASQLNKKFRYTFTCVSTETEDAYALSGTHDFSPALSDGTHTYKLTATGAGGTVTCEDTVTNTPPPPPPPAKGCLLIQKHAYDVAHNAITPVPQFAFTFNGTTVYNDASGEVTITDITPGTYLIPSEAPKSGWEIESVYPSGGQVTIAEGTPCATVVFKNKKTYIPPTVPACTLALEDDFIYPGDATALSWTTTNGAFFSIDNGIGQVTPVALGSVSVSPEVMTTYTGTVTTSTGAKATCQATLKVKPPKGECKLVIEKSADRPNAQKGDAVEYTIIFKNVGTANCTGGGVKVYDHVDSRITYVSETHSTNVSAGYNGPVWNAMDRTLRWNAHELAPGEDGWVKWKGSFDAKPAECTETVPNKAKITARELNDFKTWVESNTVNVELTKDCAPPTPDPIRIRATKIVCDKESDLPNWSGSNTVIDGATAMDYVGNHPGCHVESGWTFEWAQADVANPGDNVEAGGAGWTAFGPTDAAGNAIAWIPAATGDRIWVREQMKSDYIPFKGVVVDNVSAELYCHEDVLNYDNYDFIKHPQAGTGYYCVAWNVKKAPPPGTPECTLHADPSSIKRGKSSFLRYTTKNVTEASIDQGIGALSPVSSGQVEVKPNDSTDYVLTAKGPGGEVTCETEVNVNVPPPQPTCTLTADKGSIKPGENVTLSWTSTNADTLVFDNLIGTTIPVTNGDKLVDPVETTTYTGVWTGASGSATCSVTIEVGTEALSCDLTATPNSIKLGESSTLAWGSTNIERVDIDNGIGTNLSPAGSATITPSATGTYTYRGTFIAKDGATVGCTSVLTVTSGGCSGNCGGGGGGSRKPKIILDSATEEPLAFVYLSQIPYTGLELGPVGTFFYWSMLVLWSGAAAYLVIFAGIPLIRRRLAAFGVSVSDMVNSQVSHGAPAQDYRFTAEPAHPVPQHASHGQAAPAAHAAPAHVRQAAPEAPRGYSAHDGFRSFAKGQVLTIDDIVKGLAQEHVDIAPEEPPARPPAYLASTLRTNYNVEPIVEAPAASASTHEHDPGKYPQGYDVRGFIVALIEKDKEAVFGAVRAITRGGGDVEKFLTKALHSLDDAFRARLDGTPADAEIVRICANCETPVLERLVSSLATAVDSSYSAGITGVKLALSRALAVLD